MSKSYLFTSESVSEGHPDKVADQISDAVLDWVLAKDCNAKVACETLIAPSLVVVAGEFKSHVVPSLLAELETAIPQIARKSFGKSVIPTRQGVSILASAKSRHPSTVSRIISTRVLIRPVARLARVTRDSCSDSLAAKRRS